MICACKCLDVELQTDISLDVELELGTKGTGGGYPAYEGSYSAVPKVVDQEFPTLKTSMEENFIVHKITYLETPNVGGGLTITIGEL